MSKLAPLLQSRWIQSNRLHSRIGWHLSKWLVIEPRSRRFPKFRLRHIPAPPILSVTEPLKRISAVTIKSSLASKSANWVLLMCNSFLSVDFIAPVMPELQREPKPMAETNRIATIFRLRLASGCSGFPLGAVESLEDPFVSSTSVSVVGTTFSVSKITVDSWPAGRTGEAASAMFQQLRKTKTT